MLLAWSPELGVPATVAGFLAMDADRAPTSWALRWMPYTPSAARWQDRLAAVTPADRANALRRWEDSSTEPAVRIPVHPDAADAAAAADLAVDEYLSSLSGW